MARAQIFCLSKGWRYVYAVNKNSLKKRLNWDKHQASNIFNSADLQVTLGHIANAVNQKASLLGGAALPVDELSSQDVDSGLEKGEVGKSEVEVGDLEPAVEKANPFKDLEKIGPDEKELHEKWIAIVKDISSKPQAVIAFLNEGLAGLDRDLLKIPSP